MSTIPLLRPFYGLRPTAEKAAEVIAPPYDVLNSEEARQRAKGKQNSFLHISKAEIDFPEGKDSHDDDVYEKAASNLQDMIAKGIIKKDEKPCYYIYKIQMGEHSQTGIVAAASVADYDVNRVRKHEFTRPDKEDDRVKQIETVDAQTGPVLMAYKPIAELKQIMTGITTNNAPDYSVIADDSFGEAKGIVHTLWTVLDDATIETITNLFANQEAVYIADGHHRSASASRVAASRKAGNPNHTGKEAYNSFLTVSFPSDEMLILDYNRVIKDLNGHAVTEILEMIEKNFNVEEVSDKEAAKPVRQREFAMYTDGKWYKLTAKEEPSKDDPVAALDVSILSDFVLDKIFGIKDLRKDNRIDFVGGMRGLQELERRVDNGEMAAAFALFATSMDDLIAVADANQIMPPKSTWFEPKLADGMVSNPLF